MEFACAGEEREVLADGSARGWSNLCRHRSILLRYLAPFRAATAGTRADAAPTALYIKALGRRDPFLGVISTWMLGNHAIAAITSSESRLQSVHCCELVNSISEILLKIQSVHGVGQKALRA